MTGYGTRDVASVLGLSPAEVRSYVRSGVLKPRRDGRGQYRFTFPDLVLLRAATGLAAARIPPRRIRRALRRLALDRPPERGLSDLSLSAEGSRIVVRDGPLRFDPQSGQTLFEFEVPEVATPVASLPIDSEASERDAASADGWHRAGEALEAEEPDRARQAYEKALAHDPARADSHVNLGRLLHEGGDAPGALAHYRAALEARADDATAAFNMGVALEDLGRLPEALAAYERAIALDPVDADAHFNAANVAERLDDRAAAFAHWKCYRNLTRPRR